MIMYQNYIMCRPFMFLPIGKIFETQSEFKYDIYQLVNIMIYQLVNIMITS